MPARFFIASKWNSLLKIDQVMQRQFGEAQRRHSTNDVAGALRIYDALLARGLVNPALMAYRALALVQLGRDLEARSAAGRAAELLDDEPAASMIHERSTLGIVFRRLGSPQLAEQQLRLAFEADPSSAAIRNNLALVLTQIGRFAEADPLFEQAMAELAEDAAPALNRARIAIHMQEFGRAEEMIKIAKDRQPGHVDVALLEGQLALADADHARAFDCLCKVVTAIPIHSEAWSYMGAVDTSNIRLEPFENALAGVVKAKPTSAKTLANVVGLARKHLAWTHLEHLEQLLNEALEQDSDAVIDVGSMFLLLSANISQRGHRIAAHGGFEAFVGFGRNAPRPAPTSLDNRKLRVGYLSSDLRDHAIGFLCAGVMEAHSRNDIEWFAYVNWKDDGGKLRSRFRGSFDRFVNITELSDKDLADRIRDDGIDVLVDLNQVTAGNRIGVFSYGPAPVTVQWLGMPGTVGAGSRIDYVVLDSWTGHPGNLDGFDEQPVIMAGSYQPNDSQRPDMSLAKSRADWRLPDSAPVLCSFNQTQKFSPDTVALWADIMRQVPDAVLWVLAGEPTIEERFKRIFAESGISGERILFAERASHDVHIARLSHADLMLDNWPYNAHTTCSDALRAGTPVVTLPGATFASRVAAGILDTAGFSDWIAGSSDDYVSKAVAYLQLPFEQRQNIKATIGETYWSSPMVDCAGFARRLEAFYRFAFERALKGDAPGPCWVNQDAIVRSGLPEVDNWRETVSGKTAPDAVATQAPKTSHTNRVAQEPTTHQPDDPKPTPVRRETTVKKGSREARFHNLNVLSSSVLRLQTAPTCVDVGAKPEDKKVWDVLAARGLTQIIGFDPQCAEEFDTDANKRILSMALGDGEAHTLKLAASPGMTSLLEPDMQWLSRFPMFASWGLTTGEETLTTTRADDIPDLKGARFLKVDTQGFEKTILEHAQELLEDSLVLIELELSPVPLYLGEPTLFEVGAWLGQKGWILHTLPNINRRKLKPLGQDDSPYEGLKHIFQVDAVFMPHIDRWSAFSSDRLLSLAFLMHAIYGSHDVAALALDVLDKRDGTAYLMAYRHYLDEAGIDA